MIILFILAQLFSLLIILPLFILLAFLFSFNSWPQIYLYSVGISNNNYTVNKEEVKENNYYLSTKVNNNSNKIHYQLQTIIPITCKQQSFSRENSNSYQPKIIYLTAQNLVHPLTAKTLSV